MSTDNGDYFVNPALDPTRPWEDTPEVETELRLLAAGTPEGWVQALEALLSPDQESTLQPDSKTVSLINETARTWGFLPLIDTHDDGSFTVAPGAQAPLHRALAHFRRQRR